MKLIKMKRCPNASIVKHLRNRSVAVLKLETDECSGVVVEFKRFFDNDEYVNIPAANHLVLKGKVKVTGMVLTKECAAGLYACLHDYFTRIEKI